MHEVFENREEAGRRLSRRLERLRGSGAAVIAIPKSGVPVAATLAHRLRLEWNVIIVNKLPVPWNPQASFGALTADGSFVLNEPMIHGMRLNRRQIDVVVARAREAALAQADLYYRTKPFPDIRSKCVVVLDDGLASGYTMLAAIKSLRTFSPESIIAASPIASRFASRLIEEAADECVFEQMSASVPFSISDFYLDRPGLSYNDIQTALLEVRG